MSISPLFIYKSSVLYLVIPIIFFFLGWTRLGTGLLFSVLLLFVTYIFFDKAKTMKSNNNFIVLSKDYFIAFVLLFLFLLSTGNTGFLGCWGVDIPWRNAIYQDLIRQSWPVVYDYSQSVLCYYMTFWLVPAAISSWLNLGETGSNVALFLWMYIGLILIFLLLCEALMPKKEQVVLIAILFLFFSGINIIGMLLRSFLIEPSPLISDYPGWASWEFTNFNINGIDVVYILRNTYMNIADAYNQFFAIAIVTLLFYRFRYNPGCYAYIGLLVVPYSPIGFIGIIIIEFLELAIDVLQRKKLHGLKSFYKHYLSGINLLAILAIFPVFFLYYSMNLHASVYFDTGSTIKNSFLYIPWDKFSIGHFIIIFLYYYLYFLIYARLIYDTYRKDSIFWEILFCLVIFPFFKVGSSADFNFTATICPYFLLCVLIIKHLLQKLNSNSFEVKDMILVFFLSVAMLTPITQITSSLRGAYINNSISYKNSTLKNAWSADLLSDSLRDKGFEGFSNFLARNYDKKVFFRYFAKR
jgi:hypothetical protein